MKWMVEELELFGELGLEQQVEKEHGQFEVLVVELLI